MNCQRRAQLRVIRAELKSLLSDLENVRDDEDNALAAMPESFQFSTRGDAMQENVSALDEAVYSLESAIDQITEVIECE